MSNYYYKYTPVLYYFIIVPIQGKAKGSVNNKGYFMTAMITGFYTTKDYKKALT